MFGGKELKYRHSDIDGDLLNRRGRHLDENIGVSVLTSKGTVKYIPSGDWCRNATVMNMVDSAFYLVMQVDESNVDPSPVVSNKLAFDEELLYKKPIPMIQKVDCSQGGAGVDGDTRLDGGDSYWILGR